ncbi:transcription factor MYB98-like [Euphorbia lathyris]|uniref:transcription factor MYB98-like n=1 Tax=Euphorbia lathyris TaxID=212925 RepID=UPI0033138CE7
MFSSYSPPKMKDGFLYEPSLSSSNQLDYDYFDPQIHSYSNESSSLNHILHGVHQTSSTSTVNFQDNYEPNPFVQNGGHVQVMFNPFLPHHNPYPVENMAPNQSQIHFCNKPFNRAWQGHKKNTDIIKGKWSIEEDRLLSLLVEKYGVTKWSEVAQMVPGRNGKQCRERWNNHLRPDIKKDAWTEEEDKMLIQAHIEVGNKWAEIEKRLPGRTENSIKNHWNATKRKEYSKRKWRTQYLRGTLLQDYIRSLNSYSQRPGAAETPVLSMLQPQAMEFNQNNNQRLVSNYDLELDFDNKMFEDGSLEFLLEDMDYHHHYVSFVDNH